jgi:uncharacterized protein YigE (DUF2233 family)
MDAVNRNAALLGLSLSITVTSCTVPSAAGAPAARKSPCRPVSFEGTPFTLCDADPARHDIALLGRGADGVPMRDFAGVPARLGKTLPRLAFAMNAGMFGVTGDPIGLYVEDGRQLVRLNRRSASGGNFYKPPPNGVFYGTAKGWHLATSADFAAHRPAALSFATQSGPMLVIKGAINPGFDTNGVSLNIRNGVGIAGNGHAVFAISDAPVSFGRFARLFRRLGCADALYFDGAVSRLWVPAMGRKDSGAKIGPIVVVLQKR